MKRLIAHSLKKWLESPQRKPLVLQGARQVGKTYSVNAFGKEIIEKQKNGKYHYIDLKKELDLHSIFQENQDPEKILKLIELKKKTPIHRTQDLVFFDEIQDCASAISSLKYFGEDIPSLPIIVAGSHLGLVKNEESFPVGKVNFLSMFPLTFFEFVLNLEEELALFLERYSLETLNTIPTVIHDKLLEMLLHYICVGGLPEAVFRFQQGYGGNLVELLKNVRIIQNELLTGYEADFSKYSGTVNANHIHSVFRAVPKQLAKSYDESTSKFKFSGVIPNQKGFDRIVGPLTWLLKSRLCIQSKITHRAEHPLQAYTEENVFKVFYLDIGILNAALDTPIESIVGNQMGLYKGFIVENLVAQELFAKMDRELISWQEGQSEIEFIITKGSEIIPVEVKSSQKSRRAKSLDSFIQKYNPRFAYKISSQNVGRSDRGFVTLPHYLCFKLIT